jgi:hypothetical protein
MHPEVYLNIYFFAVVAQNGVIYIHFVEFITWFKRTAHSYSGFQSFVYFQVCLVGEIESRSEIF